MVHGSESGVHILLLFDVDKTTEHVHQFLNRIKVYQKDGKPDVAVEMTVGQICDELANYDPSALVILAHCHSSKGVTGEIKAKSAPRFFRSFGGTSSVLKQTSQTSLMLARRVSTSVW